MKPFLFALSVISLTACDPATETRKATADAPQQAAQPQTQPARLTPAGAGRTVAPETAEDQNLQWAASVVRVDYLDDQEPTAKLFGLAGGDPAMNGLYTYLAFFESPASGWRVFRLGDFLDYRVLAEGQNRVDLELDYSVMNPDTDDITSATRRIIVTWTPGADGEGPAAITVADAQ